MVSTCLSDCAKPEHSSLVVIMVTTETEPDQMASALEAGANEYIMKPFTKDILVEKLLLAGIRS
jgi:two-component system chemotaxis response regulator CheY